jgi:glycosidase
MLCIRNPLFVLLAGFATAAVHAADAPLLHVPSPDWREQVVYFLMLDRFDDGNPGNNDQGAGEYDPRDPRRYSGGDLAGVQRRLDYLQQLGVTAVWITPPVANQWWNAAVQYGGYHGYWATDFKSLDPHLGTLDDYRALSDALHRRGMYLIQDIVLNHTGDFFGYDARWNPADPAQGWQASNAGAPTQWPLNLNDPRDPAQRTAAIYHWTPPVRDHGDRAQELQFQMSGLDDLNTGNAVVRDLLRESYGHWIEQVGVDGFRVDTAFYVPEELFTDFLYSDDPSRPGIMHVARRSGRDNFHLFGEGFVLDRPYEDQQARRIETYARPGAVGPQLPAMLNFPLYGSLIEVFARGAPTAQLGHRIGSMLEVHADPHRMPSFIDNHDVDRFLADGSEAGLRQALLALMTLPGIPTVYYGTEQGFRQRRAAMFAAGWGAQGRDHFDTGSAEYLYLQRVIALRRAAPLFSRGRPRVLTDNRASAGALAWHAENEGSQALVAFNTAEHPVLLDIADAALAGGSHLQGLFAIDGEAPEAVIGADGRLLIELPPRAGYVWRVEPAALSVAATPASARIRIDPLPARVEGDLRLSGRADGIARLRLVVDDRPLTDEVAVAADGRWQATVDTGDMVDAGVAHRLLLWSPADGVASAPATFRVERVWRALIEVDDPAGDDHGPAGRYTMPTASRWRSDRPLDLLGARLSAAGRALRLDLRMRALSQAWSPANGFDHVAFTVFVEVPGRDGGARAMPLQNASLPGDMRWHWRLRVHGWGNALFSADGADASNEGTPTAPAATLAVDPANATVSLLLPGSLLAGRDDASGVRVYVTTWDYDGGYRGLQAEAGSHTFGGGDAARDPLVMDEMVIVVP